VIKERLEMLDDQESPVEMETEVIEAPMVQWSVF